MSPPRVLVVTTRWWPSDAKLALALRDAGCAVGVLCPPGNPARALRLDRIHTQRAFRHLAVLSRAIAGDPPDLVVPADERALRHLHDLHATGTDSERALIERSLGPPHTYATMTSRLESLRAAERAGLRIADTIEARSPSSIAGWVAAGVPIVLKSDGSSGGVGVRIVEGAAIAAAHRELQRGAPFVATFKRWVVNRDLFGLSDALRSGPPAIVAQRHVAGRVGDLAMFCRDGAVLGIAVAIQEQCGRLNGASTLVRLIDHPELARGAERLAAQLRLSGFVGLDFVLDDRTGEAVVIEVNPRVTPLASAAFGPDGPALAAARALGAHGRPRSEAPRSLIAYFPAAWRVEPPDSRLAGCAADVPTAEPALLAELLRTPWSDRSVLARLSALAGRLLTGRRRPGPLRWPPPRPVAPPSRDYVLDAEELADRAGRC